MIVQTDVFSPRHASTNALAFDRPDLFASTLNARRTPRLTLLHRFTGSLIAVSVTLSTLAYATPASADYGEVRAAARATGYEGVSAFERGDFVDAADKLGRAFDVVKVPTLGLWYARALEKCGKLVQAAEAYEETIQLNVVSGRIKEQKEAQAEAVEELSELQPKVPTLTLITKGSTEDVALTIDDVQLPIEVLGLARPTNPGTHSLKARREGRELEWEITLAVGEHRSSKIDLSFLHAPDDAPAPTVRAKRRSSAAALPPPAAPVRQDPESARSYGWLVAGVGAVATAAGIVTGLMARSKRDRLDNSGYCEDNRCVGAVDGLRSNYNDLRDLSTVSFIIGAMGLGAGSMVLLTTTKTKEKPSTSASVGLGSIKVEGTF